MSQQDELLEINAVYQSVAAENEALRALLTDYEALLADEPPMSTAYKAVVWDTRRVELKARYDALMEVRKP